MMRFGFGNMRSISARLKLINVFVSGIALLLAFASFLFYDTLSFERDLLHTLQTETQIIGANSGSALMFDDQQTATEVLSALRGSPEVVSAVVLGLDGKPFADYVRDASVPALHMQPMPASGADAHWRQGEELLYGSRIMVKGEQVGTIYILAKPQGLVQRTWHYAVIAAIVLLLCMVIALLMTSTFRGLLTEPLIGLARTAQIVRDEKDYSVRANVSRRDDELALLVRSFNEMLDDIQERDQQLEQSRVVLEERVQQRTAELSEANRELEAFSYTVAHDLRGPLDNIGNIGFLLQEAYGEQVDAEGRRFIDELLGGTKKMSTLIKDLLNLSRASRQTFHRQMIDLSRMATTIFDNLQAAEPERNVEVIIDPGMMVLADDGLLCVAMENLLGNAWKYTSKRARAMIEFGSMESGGETVFFVRDNGAGFDPAYSDRLFQPFQRLHVQSEFPGTGVGLATVTRIIARHEGRIWAESAVGKGATFYFTLPYAGSKQREQPRFSKN
jgi:signal transduction histidine kinase